MAGAPGVATAPAPFPHLASHHLLKPFACSQFERPRIGPLQPALVKFLKFPLDLIKEDSDILILNYPVLYSGIANIVLMKKTGRFYFFEIAYSGALKVQSYDVESGKFKKTK